jgi:excisionase family DNA binding protein
MDDCTHTYTSRRGAAQRASVGVSSIDRRIADGSLPAYRFGPKIIRIKVADVDALFAPVAA